MNVIRKVGEAIDALVVYRQRQTHPELRAFRWGGRRYDVAATNLVHVEREGETIHLCYSVSAAGEHFHVRLNTRSNQWTLDEIEIES
ncbi:MAG: hypothetical protein AB1778_06485 [Candidatus Bipolaricaulota bacterium]